MPDAVEERKPKDDPPVEDTPVDESAPVNEDAPVDEGVEINPEKKPGSDPPPDGEEDTSGDGTDGTDGTDEDVEELPSGPVDPTPEQAAAAQRAADMGIVGDPDAEPGYYVDENFRPNPLDVGSIVTTEHAGTSGYDLKAHSGLFANAGVDPLSLEENIPESPEPPPPMGATDYTANPTNLPGGEEAQAQQEASMAQALTQTAVIEPEGDQEAPEDDQDAEGDPKVAEARAKAEGTVEAAQETVAAVDEVQTPSKAQGATKKAATKATAPASPAGTKDTALEADPGK